MTVHDIHDALNFLPDDLIAAADQLRTSSGPKIIPWKRIVPMAACMVLVLSAALVFGSTLMPEMDNMKSECALEAPAAMAPQVQADMAAPEAPAGMAVPETPAEEAAPKAPPAAGNSQITQDHSHSFAEEGLREPAESCAEDVLTTVYLKDRTVALTGADSVAITEILENLVYDPELVCRCMAEFTVDTEMLTGVEVNLTEGFARCSIGQAALTQAQTETLREILRSLS